jgi:predicted nucleic acid-binding protein
MNVLDTNVWLYSHDSRDPAKQLRAQELISQTRPLALPWQVGCEFVAASRKLADAGFSRESAWAALESMTQLVDTILIPTADAWRRTKELQNRFPLSFWDALLIAACLSDGVTTLYSEDFSASPSIDGMRIVNPFSD